MRKKKVGGSEVRTPIGEKKNENRLLLAFLYEVILL